MKQEHIKKLLIGLSIILFLWAFSSNLIPYVSVFTELGEIRDFGVFLLYIFYGTILTRQVWIGLILLFMGLLMPFGKSKITTDQTNKKKRNRKAIWIILLIVGIIPFIIPLVIGINDAINGYRGICILDCSYTYGFEAFKQSILLYSLAFFPTYGLGLYFILLSIIKLITNKK